MSDAALPESWLLTQLGDVIDYGKTIKAEPSEVSDDTWVLELEDIEKGSSKILQRLTFLDRKSKSTKNRFTTGDVLYGKLRPYLNKVVVADSGGICSTEIVPLKTTENLDNHYLFHWLKHPEFLAYVTKVGYGVNMPRLGTKDGKVAPFVLAPLAEQKQIAAKLDELLAQVDTLKTRLDAIPAILKRFRQSVLAAAVSGRLTEGWRAGRDFDIGNEIDRIHESRRLLHESDSLRHLERTGKKLRPYDYSTLNVEPESRDIPSSWMLVKLGGLISFLTDYHANGSYEVLKKHIELKEREDYACMIRATNFEKNNFEDLFVYITKDAYEFLGKSKLYGGEILVGKIGNAGSVYFMPNLNRPMSLAMNLFSLRFDEKLVSSKYLYLFLTSTVGKANIQKYVRGVATKSIDKKSLRSVFINYPCFEEQTEIVRRVEQLFTFAEQIEQRVKDAQSRVNRLTQSILAKAFRGELTAEWREQNPDLISGEHSAEALLERIKAEKRETKPTKKSRRKVAV